jgi:hypothetical protein
MGLLRTTHLPRMTNREVIGFLLLTCVAACSVGTTSLGGPNEDRSALQAIDAGSDTGSDAASVSSPLCGPRRDVGAPVDNGGIVCTNPIWYEWQTVPTSAPCEYFLPSPNGDPSDGRQQNPTTKPSQVRVITACKELGFYVGSTDGCNGGDGWYYSGAPPFGLDLGADAGTPSRFMVCPKTCTTVAATGFLHMDTCQ